MELSPKIRRVVAVVFLGIAMMRITFTFLFYVFVFRKDPKLAPLFSNPYWMIMVDPATWGWRSLDFAAAIALSMESPAVLYLGLPSFVWSAGLFVVELLRQSATEPNPGAAYGLLLRFALAALLWCYAAWLWRRGMLAPWPLAQHFALGVPVGIACAAFCVYWGYRGALFTRRPPSDGDRSVISSRSILATSSPCGQGSPHYMTGTSATPGTIEIWRLDDPICPFGTKPQPMADFSPKLAAKFGKMSCYCVGPNDKQGP